jgi:hypothetical protein
MLRCETCDNPISEERIKTFLTLRGKLPETCTDCSSESEHVALMDYGHKTAGSLVVATGTKENHRRAWRVYTRDR